MWFQWDSAHYYKIAKLGYLTDPPNFGFFPLYPILMRGINFITHIPVEIAGLLIANLSFIFGCHILYRLVAEDYGKPTALRTIKYLFLMPVAFIFSGMLTESVFFLLSVLSLDYARNKRWQLAALCSFLLGLTRHVGLLIIIPLFIEYLSQTGWKIKSISRNALWLCIIPLGTILFMAFNYSLTGDPIAFVRVQSGGAGNPITAIISSVGTPYVLQVLLSILAVLAIIKWRRLLRPSLFVYSLIFAIIPLLGGAKYFPSLLRYNLIVFPLAILMAKITSKKIVDEVGTVGLALLQALLFIMWINPWMTYIV